MQFQRGWDLLWFDCAESGAATSPDVPHERPGIALGDGIGLEERLKACDQVPVLFVARRGDLVEHPEPLLAAVEEAGVPEV
jgi:hypothetical protein